MEIAVIGGGYVGVVTAVGLAGLGHRVRLGEREESKVEVLASGRAPFFEPGLDDLIGARIGDGTLVVDTDNTTVIRGADIVLLALPTPQSADGHADLSILHSAVDDLAPKLDDGSVLVVKSTVPVGTTTAIADRLNRPVVMNPEFLREGSAVGDFQQPDRVIVGGADDRAVALVVEMYEPLAAPTVTTSAESAELIKYASNAYLATRVSFANEMANISDSLGIDGTEVLRGMCMDHRIGPRFLAPGPGWGGSCFPKDTAALVALSEDHGYSPELIRAAMHLNARQAQRLIGRLEEAVGDLEGVPVAVWGLAFKAGTDDIRDSPALRLIDQLLRRGAHITAYDPHVAAIAGLEIDRAASAHNAVENAKVLVVATEWPEFVDVDVEALGQQSDLHTVLDTRNMLDRTAVERAGLTYLGVGR